MVTNLERERVEELIRAQTPPELTVLHPNLGESNLLSDNRSLLMQELSRFEEEEFRVTLPDTILSEGISMIRYSDFSPEYNDNNEGNNIDLSKMFTVLSYSVLRDRNARFGAENSSFRVYAKTWATEKLHNMEKCQEQELQRRRQRVEEVQTSRQAKQMQFQPVGEYMEQRWKDGISNLVDIGLIK